MPDTLIVQSYRTTRVSSWIIACMASVKQWATDKNYAYEFVDDRFFEPVPDWYRKKCIKQILPVTDLARLLLIQHLVSTRFLSQLASAMPVAQLSNVGMFSPALISELAHGKIELAQLFAARSQKPIAAANLCASLCDVPILGVCVNAADIAKVIDIMLASHGNVINQHIPQTNVKSK